MEFFESVYHSKADKVSKLISSLKSKDKNGIYNFVKALNDEHEHSGHLVIIEKLLVEMLPKETTV